MIPPSLPSSLPLPLAQLLRRALNSKSPHERHNCAFYLGEAAIKLQAAGRIGAWIGAGEALDPGSIEALEALARPSLGHWIRLSLLAEEALARLERPCLFQAPSRRAALSEAGLLAVQALLEEIEAAQVLENEAISQARRRGMSGFFELLLQYRNRVLAHGGERPPPFYERFGPLLLEAVAQVVSTSDLLDGARLVLAQEGEAGSVRDLTGFGSAASAEAATSPESSRPPPRRLLLVRGDLRAPLHPLLVHHWDEDQGQDLTGFLNRVVRRMKGASREYEVQRTEYLEYTTGTELLSADTRKELAAFFTRLRRKAVTTADIRHMECHAPDQVSDRPIPVVDEAAFFDGFEIEKELGRGGMGVVYLARQLSLERRVALKLLHPVLAPDPGMTARFRTEIRALSVADHPSIVRVLTTGQQGDRLYYAMEYVDGADLSEVLRVVHAWQRRGIAVGMEHVRLAVATPPRGTPTGMEPVAGPDEPGLSEEIPDPPSELTLDAGGDWYRGMAALFAETARGLHHLHERAIIHRDIKPGNLILTRDARRLVIADLGLARFMDLSRPLTRSGAGHLGTLRYSSPEQCESSTAALDGRTDVYSLCVTLYEAVTGRPIFDGQGEARLVFQVVNEEPAPPRQVNPAIPEDLERILLKGISKRREERHASAAALAAELEAFARGEGKASRGGGKAQSRVLQAGAGVLACAALAVAGGQAWRAVSPPAPVAVTPAVSPVSVPEPPSVLPSEPEAAPAEEVAPADPPPPAAAATRPPSPSSKPATPPPAERIPVHVNSWPYSAYRLEGDPSISGNTPFHGTLPPGRHVFELRREETGQVHALTVQVRSGDKEVTRCWNFEEDKPC